MRCICVCESVVCECVAEDYSAREWTDGRADGGEVGARGREREKADVVAGVGVGVVRWLSGSSGRLVVVRSSASRR